MDVSNISMVLSAIALAGVVISILMWWLRLVPTVAIIALGIALITGQVIRLPLPGQGGGLLLSDIAVVLVHIAALFHIETFKSRFSQLIGTYIPFLLWSVFALVLYSSHLITSEFLVALAYWIRLALYLLLVPSLTVLAQRASLAANFRRIYWISCITLVTLGCIQFFVLPDLSILHSLGWDPHQYRLVSTWLDPNFFGLYLVLNLIFLLCQKSFSTRTKTLGALVLLILLILTRSRSSFLALGVVAIIISPLFIWYVRSKLEKNKTPQTVTKLNHFRLQGMTLIMLGGIWIILAGVFLGSRFQSLFTYDPTAHLRLEAMHVIWFQLAQPHLLTGVGYNAYQFAAQQAGLGGDFTIHSRAGSDNSFLTLVVTTGIPGFIMFLLPWIYLIHLSIKKFIKDREIQFLALPFSLIAVTVHAQIVNSFLYSHILITLACIAVLSVASSPQKAVRI